MGDGIQRRFAIIINGDTEPHHLGNVEHAVEALRAEGEYQIAVASTERPTAPVEHYIAAEAGGLQQLLFGITSDDDDQIVVYITGHGDAGTRNEGCVNLTDTCLEFRELQRQLDQLQYGRRIMVLDNCFGGGALSLFANPRSTVVTQGSPGETVSCQTFSPYFWSLNATDENRDGVLTIQERYAYALREGRTDSHTRFYEAGSPAGLSGRSALQNPFEAHVVEVHDAAALETQLHRLQPGQLALVTFSADWCGPCREYQSTFDEIARQNAGGLLMIRAEGRNGTEREWQRYGVSGFPTVAFIDHEGTVTPVENRDRPMDSLLNASLGISDSVVAEFRDQLRSDDFLTSITALLGLSRLGSRVTEVFPQIFQFLNRDMSIPLPAAQALAALARERPDFLRELQARLNQTQFRDGARLVGLIARENPELETWLHRNAGSSEPGLRAGCLLALGTSDDRRVQERLRLLIEHAEHDPDFFARTAALESLRFMGGAENRVVPMLLRRLNQESPDGIPFVLRALSSYPGAIRRTLPIFQNYLHHPGRNIRLAAVAALGTLAPNLETQAGAVWRELFQAFRAEDLNLSWLTPNSRVRLFDPVGAWSTGALPFPLASPLGTALTFPAVPLRNLATWERAATANELENYSLTFSRLMDSYPGLLHDAAETLSNEAFAPALRNVLERAIAMAQPDSVAILARQDPLLRQTLTRLLRSDGGNHGQFLTNPMAAARMIAPEFHEMSEELANLLTHPNETIRDTALEYLTALSHEHPESVISVVERPDLALGIFLELIVQWQDTVPTENLVRATLRIARSNPDRARLLRRLWENAGLGIRPHLPLLLEAFADPDPNVRHFAERSLLNIARQTPALLPEIEAQRHNSSSDIRAGVERILERLAAEPESERPLMP